MVLEFAQVYINDRLIGLYNLMEAPDQEYVFARNFPKYDPLNYYLYKFKTMAANKCQFEESMLQSAKLTRRGCDDRKCTSTDGGEGKMTNSPMKHTHVAVDACYSHQIFCRV